MVGEFLHLIKGQIHVENTWTLEIQRQNDRCLMDLWIMLRTWKFSPKELKRLHACCMFWWVVTVADILTEGTEKYITPNMLKGLRHQDRSSRYQWPHQPRPSHVYGMAPMAKSSPYYLHYYVRHRMGNHVHH